MGNIAQAALKIFTLAVLARHITPREFGVIGVFTIITEFSKMLSTMGFGPAIVQRLNIESRHLFTGFTASLFIGLILGLITWLSAPFLADYFDLADLGHILKFTPILFLIESASVVGTSLLQRNMMFRHLALIDLVSYSVGYTIIGILLSYQGYGVWSLVHAVLFQSITSMILVFWVQPFPKKFMINYSALKEMLIYGWGTTLGRLGNFFAVQGDNFIVAKTLGAGALGIYGRAYNFMVMPVNLFGNSLEKVMFTAMSKVQNERSKLAKAYLAGSNLISIAASAMSVIIIGFAEEIIYLILGEQWSEVTVPFKILAGGILFRMGYKMSESLTRATGAVFRRAKQQFIYAILVIAGAYFGHFYGINGVAFGVLISLILNFMLMARMSLKILKLGWTDFLGIQKKALILFLITIILVQALKTLFAEFELKPIATLILGGSITGIFLIILILKFRQLFFSKDLLTMVEDNLPNSLKKFFLANKNQFKN